MCSIGQTERAAIEVRLSTLASVIGDLESERMDLQWLLDGLLVEECGLVGPVEDEGPSVEECGEVAEMIASDGERECTCCGVPTRDRGVFCDDCCRGGR